VPPWTCECPSCRTGSAYSASLGLNDVVGPDAEEFGQLGKCEVAEQKERPNTPRQGWLKGSRSSWWCAGFLPLSDRFVSNPDHHYTMSTTAAIRRVLIPRSTATVGRLNGTSQSWTALARAQRTLSTSSVLLHENPLVTRWTTSQWIRQMPLHSTAG
jgi:hypothetical protein